MKAMIVFLYLLIGLCSLAQGQAIVSVPSTGIVWTNGGVGQIAWSNIPGSSFSIVLSRIGTIYHHTITSTAANTGSYTWSPVNIPGQDGWPASSSTDLVYQIDFYVNGGWNNGGTHVAQSSPFAIVWSGAGGDPQVVTVNPNVVVTTPVVVGGFYTTTRTQVIVGVITTTIIVTEIVQATPPNQGSTVVVVQPPPVVTITNTAQLITITRNPVAGVTTIVGPSPNNLQPQLYNSGASKDRIPYAIVMMGIVLVPFWLL